MGTSTRNRKPGTIIRALTFPIFAFRGLLVTMKIQHWFLLCFLTLSAFVSCVSYPSLGLPPVLEEPEDHTKGWQATPHVDPVYNTDGEYLFIVEAHSTSNGHPVTLTVESSGGVYIHLPFVVTGAIKRGYNYILAELGSPLVHYRFDQDATNVQVKGARPRQGTGSLWRRAADPHMVFPRDERAFLTRLKKASTLTVKAAGVDGEITAIFDVSGLVEIMESHGF